MGVLQRIVFPFSAQHSVEIVVVNRLFVIAPDTIDQLNQRTGEDRRSLPDEPVTSLIAVRIAGLPGSGNFSCGLLDPVGIDGRDQTAYDTGQGHAAGGLGNTRLLLLVELRVEARQAAGERADGIFV